MEADWEGHAETKHKKGEEFWCPDCKKTLEECYEEHMAMHHRNRCLFCEEIFQEPNRRQHTLKKHQYPCPICDKPIDTLLEVHVKRAHPCFKGFCKCKTLQKNNNSEYYYEQCNQPCYRVSGCEYINHLLGNSRGVGDNAENSEFDFAWCPCRDFSGPRGKVLSHIRLKHEGCFYECATCGQVDFERTGMQHRQTEHDKIHWWCEGCVNSVSYESEDEKERPASRNAHLLTHEGIYMKCPGCCDAVCPKNLIAHALKKHPGKFCFCCFICGKCAEGDPVKHMEEAHEDYYYCEICGIWLSLSPFEHFEEEHEDCCFFCRVYNGSFEDRVKHIKNIHPNVESCTCGELILPYEAKESWHCDKHKNFFFCHMCNKDFPNRTELIRKEYPYLKQCDCGEIFCPNQVNESWHTNKHRVRYPLCKQKSGLEHMSSLHKCTDKCKPIPSKRKIWE